MCLKGLVDNQESALFCVGDNPSSNMCMLRFDPDVLNFYSDNSKLQVVLLQKENLGIRMPYHVVHLMISQMLQVMIE